ncbi:serine hydrolase domain-containing protein [Marinicella sp. W31]|uniref:serine hydrolase domain-containing protein n=1 Tax=Marinicella sp. W31 TaxID=3023713 RepID=UPI0037570E49
MLKKIVLLQMLWSLSYAQIPAEIKTEADLRVQHGYNPSIVIGFYQDGQFDYYATGYQNRQNKTAATVDSLYEIGSITKTFTALLLAEATTLDQLKLDDPIDSYWPDQMVLHDQNKRVITFKDLATHSSGLYRMPVNLHYVQQDLFADYDTQLLQEAFPNPTPNPVASQYLYSNLGFGLLGESLARALKNDYETLIEQRILKPLNLANTFFHVPESQQIHLATGYKGGQATSHWSFKALAGAGALKSNIKDLLSYGIQTLNEQPESLNAALKLVKQQHFSHKGVRIALGWHFSGPFIWHNGGTGGFSTMLMIDPNRRIVVAAMTNADPNNNVEDIASALMSNNLSFQKYQYPVSLNDEILNSRIGIYRHPKQGELRLELKDGALIVKKKMQPSMKLSAVKEDTFTNSMHRIEVIFKEPDQLIYTKKGRNQTYTYQKTDSQ